MYFYLFLCSLICTFDFVEGYSRSKEKIKNCFFICFFAHLFVPLQLKKTF